MGIYQPSKEDSSYVLLYQEGGAIYTTYRISRQSALSSNFSLTQPGVSADQSTCSLIAVETSEIMHAHLQYILHELICLRNR